MAIGLPSPDGRSSQRCENQPLWHPHRAPPMANHRNVARTGHFGTLTTPPDGRLSQHCENQPLWHPHHAPPMADHRNIVRKDHRETTSGHASWPSVATLQEPATLAPSPRSPDDQSSQHCKNRPLWHPRRAPPMADHRNVVRKDHRETMPSHASWSFVATLRRGNGDAGTTTREWRTRTATRGDGKRTPATRLSVMRRSRPCYATRGVALRAT
ncbi:hypothetical protein G1C96_1122 [Bifidobacterium sp. DSM 109958]|uniref:Uncharacterized protein n=1 Tax=Bifidobacterium moraviense TaxID=2675323 RepID=A0A7Y0F218_9BIFI|nr:hypothetical protein [Bifidobacterium sp. DSM 109958]